MHFLSVGLNVSHDIIGVPLLVLQVLRDHYPCIDLGFGFRCFVGGWGVGGYYSRWIYVSDVTYLPIKCYALLPNAYHAIS